MMLYNYNITSIIIFLFFILNVIAFCKINTARNLKRIKQLKDTDIYIAETLKKINSGIEKNENVLKKPIKKVRYKEDLKKIPFDCPYHDDDNSVSFNTRIKHNLYGFFAVSCVKKNSYIEPKSYDTCKQIKCIKGSFFDSKTNRWYRLGEFLVVYPFNKNQTEKNWHDIKTGSEDTELLIFLMPK